MSLPVPFFISSSYICKLRPEKSKKKEAFTGLPKTLCICCVVIVTGHIRSMTSQGTQQPSDCISIHIHMVLLHIIPVFLVIVSVLLSSLVSYLSYLFGRYYIIRRSHLCQQFYYFIPENSPITFRTHTVVPGVMGRRFNETAGMMSS